DPIFSIEARQGKLCSQWGSAYFPSGLASVLVHCAVVVLMKLIDEFRHGWQGISQPSPAFSVGFAAACLILATLFRWGLAHIRPDVFFTPYIPAVFFATAVSGLRTGALTAIAGGVLGLVVNFGDSTVDTARIALLLIFWLVSGLTIWGVVHYRS